LPRPARPRNHQPPTPRSASGCAPNDCAPPAKIRSPAGPAPRSSPPVSVKSCAGPLPPSRSGLGWPSRSRATALAWSPAASFSVVRCRPNAFPPGRWF
jgi:hypothetical protein